MKRNQKAEKLKEFLRLEDKLRVNWEVQRNLGYKPLEKPIPHGYEARWVLREDVSRRSDAYKFQYILDNFGKAVWCKRKDFKEWDYQSKKLVDLKPYFREINPKEYEGLSLWAKKFFTEGKKYNKWGNYTYSYYYVNIPSYYIVSQVKRDYKTHSKIIDEILQREEAELEAILNRDFYNERQAMWNSHRSNKSWRKIFHRSDRSKTRQIIKKNVINAIDGEHYNDSIELGLGKGNRCWW